MFVNLKNLFWMQGTLDEHILQEQGLKKAPFNERILALIAELGECANEWQGFKYWKRPENRQPNIRAKRFPAMMPEDQIFYNPMLEEYVDMLHFILSLGLELKVKIDHERVIETEIWMAETITEQFLMITGKAYELWKYKDPAIWESLFRMFVALGEILGFTWDQVENAYFEKNAINHARQVQKY